MKNFIIFLLLTTIVLFSGCSKTVSVKAKESVPKFALVYLYVSSANGNINSMSDSVYTVKINNKKVDTKIVSNEYMSFNLSPSEVELSITRAQIEERALTLNLEASKTYYLRIKTDLDDGGFEFEEVRRSIGMQEILRTGLAGSTLQEDIEFIEISEKKEDKSETIQIQNSSKTDEIKKAYNLKEQGVITNKEFEALKAEILAN